MNSPHIGFHSDRLHPDADNPREVAFAEQWLKINTQALSKPLLEYLLSEYPTERDAQVAATVVQWLGTNVGMSFIRDVMEREPKVATWLKELGD